MRIVIVGAGPTGLAAGFRLHELGYDDFLVLEERHHAGGLAASELSPGGFTYDIGGHVLFSHFRYFDELFEHLLGYEYQELQRDAWIWMRERFLPYPFQNNIKDLPAEVVLDCVIGIVEARCAKDARSYADFEKLIYGVFGRGIADHFMMPYNFKVWAHPPRMLATSWIGERVPVVDLERVLRNVILNQEDRSWGPNSTFKYPRHGGTGGLFARIVPVLGNRIRFGAAVTGVDARHKRAAFGWNGRAVRHPDQYDATRPADRAAGRGAGCHAGGRPPPPALGECHRRGGPAAACTFHEVLDLLSGAGLSLLPRDLPFQLLARRRAGRRDALLAPG
jgi:protoporphyrinogen oxidase